MSLPPATVDALRAAGCPCLEDPSEFTAVEDVGVGAFDVALGPVVAPVFLRLARPTGDPVDLARATYLLLAGPRLRAGRAGWVAGPGLAVSTPPADIARLRDELFEVGHSLRVLGEIAVARSYVELWATTTTQPRVSAPVAETPQREEEMK